MDAVEEVKSRLSIEEVIGEYVQLKRAGRNWRGLSPFTSEKSPSFMVSPEKQIWHDFSSGKGGNMFSFVMEVEGLDFRQALELLARKAGVDLEQYRTGSSNDNGKIKERLYEVLELATKYYQVQFIKTKAAYEYILGKRAFSKDTALEWRIGYAPNTGTDLMDFLRHKNFTDEEVKRAGLSAQRYRGVGDMFRGRIMIPLQDPQGRVIGFTARLLVDDPGAPKYINTPQTALYDKSRHIYGLHLAKEAIRKSKIAVLVEGNLDVIASHQAGVRNVTATAGTALTEQHLKALSRFTDDIRLSFDADKAGINATERSIPIASKVGVSLSIITLPSGKDPDELIRQNPKAWHDTIQQSQYALDWLIERYSSVLDIHSATGKKQFSDVLLPIVYRLQDSVEQDHYVTHIAQILGVSTEALRIKLHRMGASTSPRKAAQGRKPVVVAGSIDRVRMEYIKTQDHLLSLLLLYPELRSRAQLLTEDMLVTEQARRMLGFLTEYPDFKGNFAELAQSRHTGHSNGSHSIADTELVQSMQDYAKILVLQYEELYQGVESLELDYEVTRLQARLIKQYIKIEKDTLVAQLGNADKATTHELLTRVKALDALLNQAQGGHSGGQKEEG